MSMMGPQMAQGRGTVGETVATFPTYEAAQKAVSSLIASDVPAREIAIVGKGLRSVERVTGRLGYAAAARSGAINGVLLGLFFSAIVVLGTPSVPIQVFVGVLFVGIAIGMLLSIVTYSFVRRRRDFASVTQVTADSYEIAVSAGAIQRARQILGGHGAAPAAAQPPAGRPLPPAAPAGGSPDEDDRSARPRYGERIPPEVSSTGPAAPPPDPGPGPGPEQTGTSTPSH